MYRTGMTSNQEMFEKVCRLFEIGHRWIGHTPEQTLNRLFTKHLDKHQPDIAADPPQLTSDSVTVTIECWFTPELKQLAPEDRIHPPGREDLPVVIVRYRGRNCLIDGGKRIHRWHVAGDKSNHPAYVLDVIA